MRIGNLELKNPFIAAPLAGVTDAPTRSIAASMGAALTCSEMVSGKGMMYGNKNTEELLKIRETNGTSILLVTHHLGIARKMADNIGIMKDGRLIEYGNTGRIFDSPENEYTKKLIRDVPRLKK